MRKPSGSKARQQRVANAAAAKQRRTKVMAFGGLGVLAILLFIQVPKLLGGSESPAPAVVAAAPVTTAPETGRDARALRLLKATGTDPFATRSLADNDPRAGSVSGPGGTHDPFAGPATSAPPPPAAPPTEDPVAAPITGKIVVGTPTPGAVAKRGWIVVLASVQTRLGRAYAERFATKVRRNGLGSPVSVLDSSTRKPLRSGYYVVYTGPFASLASVQRSAAHVHAFGYRTAYVREILQY